MWLWINFNVTPNKNKNKNIMNAITFYTAVNILGIDTGIIGTYKIIQYKFKDCLDLISIVPVWKKFP